MKLLVLMAYGSDQCPRCGSYLVNGKCPAE